MKKVAFSILILSILSIIAIGVIKINEELPNTIRSKAEIKFNSSQSPINLTVETKNYTISISPGRISQLINSEAFKFSEFKDNILKKF